ncbi:MAG TPA: SOS response-associated peptidase [Afifellaceae bacterium]|nr:SOS response-associated peptidase [Afifellaceae bacterium]
MCGRYGLIGRPEEIRDLFGLDGIDPLLCGPRYNIAPTQPALVVRTDRQRHELVPMRWGLVPSWVKDPQKFPLLINARAEGLADKPAFRAACRHRRCLVPASGFYEWQATGGRGKQPYWIRPAAGGLVAFAGLWETWHDRDGGEIDTAAIVTTAACEGLRAIHTRMPAVLAPQDWAAWLSPDTPPEEALALIGEAAAEALEAIPVSTRVNAVANDDSGLIEPEARQPAPAEPAEEAEAQPRLL